MREAGTDGVQNARCGNVDAAVVVRGRAPAQAGGGRRQPAGGDDRPGPDRTGDGVQRQRRGGGEPLPGFHLFSQAPSGLAGLRVSAAPIGVADGLHGVETAGPAGAGTDGGAAGSGVDSLHRRDGQGGPPLDPDGPDLGAAGRDGQAGGYPLYGGVSHQAGGPVDRIRGRISSAAGRRRPAGRAGPAAARPRHRRRGRPGDLCAAVSGGRAAEPSVRPRAGRAGRRRPAGLAIAVPPATPDDLFRSREGSHGRRLPGEPVVSGIRQRRGVRSRAGRGPAETVFSARGAHRLRARPGRRRIGTGRDGRDHGVVRPAGVQGISDCGTRPRAVRPPSCARHYAADRIPGADQRGRGHRAAADQGPDAAAGQLRRFVAAGVPAGDRHSSEHFA